MYCRRKLSISKYSGQTMVDIREYYEVSSPYAYISSMAG